MIWWRAFWTGWREQASQNLAGEGWFVEAVKQAAGERGDLRMVLNLEKIVPSPYFRSYWVQRNVTEMKQYSSAVSDLYRTSQSYREERVLVRRAGLTVVSHGDVRTLAALAPEDVAFYAAQASPDAENLLRSLRDNLLEVRPERQAASYITAPAAVAAENAGSAAHARYAHRQGSGCGEAGGCVRASARAAGRPAAGGIARSVFHARSERRRLCLVAGGDGCLRRASLG
jgi:hypothetical protein